MIAYLQGDFTEKKPDQVYLDINGVGYEVNISLHTFSKIQELRSGKLYTHLQIREDSHVLYGFFEREEKEMFLHLIGVSGIGAATARMMLSYSKPDELAGAIRQGNVKLLESIKGIGKKTAERLVLELKDKVGKAGSVENPVISSGWGNNLSRDALQALTALGITRQQAEASVQKIILAEPQITNVEELIKKALKAI